VYLLESSSHNLGTVVDGEDNVGDTSSSKSSNLVLNHGLVGKLDQRFGESKGERTQTGTETADENESCMASSVLVVVMFPQLRAMRGRWAATYPS
jgi:hypothetical protein